MKQEQNSDKQTKPFQINIFDLKFKVEVDISLIKYFFQ